MVKKSSKPKKRRAFTADKHNSKARVETATKNNPFDLHVNRLKHDVLGKRRNYERGGQPLKARSRGIEKRKRTLLKELKSVFKKSTFIDHRLGENDPTLTADEKLMQRLIAERTKLRPGKESRYNLNDEEDLTHYGQSLSKSDELNQKPVIDDYDDENDPSSKGRMKSDHFFGGFDSANEPRKPQTKKEWIEDMIKSTKLDKYERQRENEKIFDMTETLDEQWKALSALMGIKDKKTREIRETADDYDKLVSSLKFDPKTTGLPVKTIQETEKEAADRLKTLQVEESQRMERPTIKSILSKNRQSTHVSVEELDDSYYVLDSSKRRVTFDEGDEQNETPLPGIDDDETPENGDDSAPVDDDEDEEEETSNVDLTAEYEEIPSNVDQLQDRLREEKNTLNVIWKRINDKRLPAIPKSVLSNYFDVLLDHYESNATNSMLLNQVGKHLLLLLQLVNNEQTRSNIIERLKRHQAALNDQIESEKFCQLDSSSIFFLKLIGHLYPTSDFRHPITTPAMTFLVQAINHASLSSLSACRQALLLMEIVKEWISKTNCYVPEMIVLLMKLMQSACTMEKRHYAVSCSSKQMSNAQLLVLNGKVSLSSSMKWTYFETESLDDDDDQHRSFILHTCLNQFTDFLNIYRSLSSIAEIVQPFKVYLTSMSDTCKCDQISSQCREILILIGTLKTDCLAARQPLEQGKQPTKILQLFEPRFGVVYEGKKNTRLPKEFTDRLRLRQKYKREFKSTVRTIVLDNQFIAREEHQEQMAKDSQRKRKVKDIHAQLSMQEGEYRKFQKTK